VRVTGDGTALLLLHGWGASSELFEPVTPLLADGRRVIVPDLPGFGETPPPPEPWDVAAYAEWTLALLDRLEVQRADVVGHSNGGRIAIMLAARHPDRIGSVVLTSSAGIRPRRGLRQRWNVRMFKAMRRTARSSLLPQPVRERLQGRVDRRGSPDYQAATGVMRQTLVRIVNEDLRGLLPRIAAPVLLIWGERDEETPLSDAHLMERLIPDGGLVVFEGAGHYAYLEQPGRFAHIVDVFLRDTRGARA